MINLSHQGKSFVGQSLEATEALAKAVFSILLPGDMVLLRGGLGAGKTTFVRAMLSTHTEQEVNSPTFSLQNVYSVQAGAGLGSVYKFRHFDFYRIESEHEFENLGWDEFFFSKDICIVEWFEKFISVFKGKPEKNIILVDFKVSDQSVEYRNIEIYCDDLKAKKLQEALSL